MRRLVSAAIVVSWIALTLLLVRKQVPPPAAALAPVAADAATERDEWFGVYQQGRKIGHAHRVLARTHDGYQMLEDSVVQLAMLGTPQTLRTTLSTETDDHFGLRRFDFTLITPATVFGATGTSDGRRLVASYGPRGHQLALDVALDEPIVLTGTVRPRMLAGDLTPGARYGTPVFSPLTMRSEPMTVIVEGRETMTGPSGPVDAVRIREETQGLVSRAWLAPDGAVLREEAALGFALERETRDQALAGVDTSARVDLVAVSAIPLTGRIADPRDLASLTLEVTGAAADRIPNDPPRQRMTGHELTVTREPLTAAPIAFDAAGTIGGADLASFRAPAPFLESDDPAIVAEAHAITAGAADAREAARRLVLWVEDALDKTPSVTVPSAREVLASRRGDCNEHAVLLTALARAAGIPARVVAGAVYANDGFYYHAWTELWLDGWTSADAVFGQLPTDATHVKLLEGGPERHLALAGVIGQLAFAVEESRE